MRATNIFISHSSVDKDLARQLNHELIRRRYATFFDEQSIPVGASFPEKIHEAVNVCDLFLVLLSPEALRSPEVWHEVGLARGRWPEPKGRVITVAVRQFAVEALPPYLRYLNWQRLTGDRSTHAHQIAEVAERAVREMNHQPLARELPENRIKELERRIGWKHAHGEPTEELKAELQKLKRQKHPTRTVGDVVCTPGGEYWIERELCDGNSCNILKARKANTNVPVVLKVLKRELRQDDLAKERFIRGAKATATKFMSHPHIVQTSEVVEEPYPLCVMELVEGESLLQLVERGNFGHADIQRILGQLVAALECVHRLGRTHRNLHPSHVLVASDGTVKLTGFSQISPGRPTSSTGATRHDGLQRSSGYASEGQRSSSELKQTRDPRYDQAGLASIVVFMLVRRAIQDGVLVANPELITGLRLPEAVASVLKVATAPSLAQRWPDVRAFFDAYCRVAHALVHSAPPPVVSYTFSTPPPTGSHSIPTTVRSSQMGETSQRLSQSIGPVISPARRTRNWGIAAIALFVTAIVAAPLLLLAAAGFLVLALRDKAPDDPQPEPPTTVVISPAAATPNGTPDVTPGGTPDVTPGGTPDVTPGGTPDVTPGGTPDVTPGGTPIGTGDSPQEALSGGGCGVPNIARLNAETAVTGSSRLGCSTRVDSHRNGWLVIDCGAGTTIRTPSTSTNTCFHIQGSPGFQRLLVRRAPGLDFEATFSLRGRGSLDGNWRFRMSPPPNKAGAFQRMPQ